MAIPWSVIGSPTALQFMVYGSGKTKDVWTAFPGQNPSTSNGAETFSHYYHIDNINNATSPNSIPVVEAGGVDKVDDALNWRVSSTNISRITRIN